MTSPSRMRKSPSGLTSPVLSSCVPAGPMMPIEVLLIVSSLSCCSVSRSACRPCRMRSSSEPGAGRGRVRGGESRQRRVRRGTKRQGEGRRTVGEALVVLLEVGLCALGARADGHGVVLVRVAGWGELVQMGALLVLSDHEEAHTVRAPAIFLCVHLRLWVTQQPGVSAETVWEFNEARTYCLQLRRRDGSRVRGG